MPWRSGPSAGRAAGSSAVSRLMADGQLDQHTARLLGPVEVGPLSRRPSPTATGAREVPYIKTVGEGNGLLGRALLAPLAAVAHGIAPCW